MNGDIHAMRKPRQSTRRALLIEAEQTPHAQRAFDARNAIAPSISHE
ncbi:hypothetical protein ACFOEY_02515 [Paracandidimonas soli]